jgi:hypothetical protein
MPDYFVAPTQPAGPPADEKVTQNAYFDAGNVILETVDVTKLARTCSATEVAQIMGKRPAKATLRRPEGSCALALTVVYADCYYTLRLPSLTFENFIHITETRLVGRVVRAAEISHLRKNKKVN